MNQAHAKNRSWSFCLVFMLVLILGLMQWSILPLLIDGGVSSSNSVLVISAGHTSKFAAPFKCLFADSLSPCLPRSEVSVPMFTVSFFHRNEEPPAHRDARFFSHRQLRAPPSV
jgi:hypothetical protein